MNIQERNDRILQYLELLRIGGDHVRNQLANVNIGEYYERLWKPPIINYIPYQVIQYLLDIVNDVKLMNNPIKRFNIQNDLLGHYYFRPLASGTNRRAFYCEYDPGIVLKIASDTVGMSDNISEFYLQQYIKPFCTKIYDVQGNGVVSLSERVEPMTEYEYKYTWLDFFFKLIYVYWFEKKRYVLEDVGSKFFKNFGYRLCLNPVLLDFPYIYKINESKMHCVYQDPVTKEVCNGDIGYDFDMGMSQIICYKCGRRYAARYLSQDETLLDIALHKKTRLNTDVPVVLVKGGDVIYDPHKIAS